jgi:hypothetical protein
VLFYMPKLKHVTSMKINYILNLIEKDSSLLIKYRRTSVTNNKANYDSLLFFQFSPLLPCCHSYFIINIS